MQSDRNVLLATVQQVCSRVQHAHIVEITVIGNNSMGCEVQQVIGEICDAALEVIDEVHLGMLSRVSLLQSVVVVYAIEVDTSLIIATRCVSFLVITN